MLLLRAAALLHFQAAKSHISLSDHLRSLGSQIREGHSGEFPAQTAFLAQQAAKASRIAEIGFNAGHSAAALLEHAPMGTILLSMDLGRHAYTKPLEAEVRKIIMEASIQLQVRLFL